MIYGCKTKRPDGIAMKRILDMAEAVSGSYKKRLGEIAGFVV
jgi:hypothetical protein